ncbi:MAG: hypothetical protein WCP29_15620 [Acidobacteriota bacterium]
MRVPTSIRCGLAVVCSVSVTLLAGPAALAQTTANTQTKPAAKPAPKPSTPQKPTPPKVVTSPPTPAPPVDLVVTTRHVSGETTTTSTVSTKGTHQRIDYGPDMAVLQQCGVDRIIQVNDQTRKYLTLQSRKEPEAGAEPPAKTGKKGGTITYSTTVTDTGERKTLFGMSARHVKTVLTKTSTPDACDKRPERVDTDGWFVDPPVAACPAVPRPATATTADGCRDVVHYVGAAGAAIGYPLAYTTASSSGAGKDAKASSMRMEVTNVARRALPDSLFVVPKGYTDVPNLAQLGVPADGAKRAGVIRICAASVSTRTDHDVSLPVLSDALVESLGEAGYEAVRLVTVTPDDQRAEIRTRECDYVLTTEIADVRKPGKGILGRVAGTTGGFGAKVDYRLVAPGSAKPALSSSEHSGKSTIKTVIGAAKVVSHYLVTLGLFGSNANSMNALVSMGGTSAAPEMSQSPDAVVTTAFSLVDKSTAIVAKATGNRPDPDLNSEVEAVAAAMTREVRSVAAFLAKKKQ